MKRALLKEFCFLIIGIGIISCDSNGITNIEKESVNVRYVVSLSNGAKAIVHFADSTGTKTDTLITESWSKEYIVNEGSHLLYLTTEQVRFGSLNAEIFIDSELKSSHSNVDSVAASRSSFAWAPEEGSILYFARGKEITRPQVILPTGEARELYTMPLSRGFAEARLRLVGSANSTMSISTTRPPAEQGFHCFDLGFRYYPNEVSDVYHNIDMVRLCDTRQLDMRIDATIPGY